MQTNTNNILLSVNGEKPCSYNEFIQANSSAGVTPIPANLVELVEKLLPGETLYIGISEVKRVA